MEIKIIDHISNCVGITPKEGQPIYQLIVDNISQKNVVCLDFLGVDMLTTAFLNVVIGNLYKDYSSEDLKGYLMLKNLDDATARRIKKVTENAKSFYKDQTSFTNNIETILDGQI